MKHRYNTRSSTAAANASGESTSSSAKRPRRSTSTRRKAKAKKKEPKAANARADIDMAEEVSAQCEKLKAEEGTSSANTTQETTIEKLPDMVLVKIFELLNLSTRIRIERVCRRWSKIGRFYSWSHTHKIDFLHVADNFITLDISDDESDEPDEDFMSARRLRRRQCQALLSQPRLANNSLCQLLDRAGAYLRSIDLSGYRDSIDYRVLRFIGQQCPNLESINFTGVLVTNTSLRNLAMGCTRLKSISFQRCFHDSVVDRGLSSLLSSCPELVSLNLSENERVSGRSFDELPATVLHLDLSACYELKDEAIKALADRCPSLRTLHLDCCDRVSVDSLAYAFNRLSQLRVLRLNEYYVFGDTPSPAVVAAMQNLNKLSHLTELYLNNNYLIDDTVICAVARGCPSLAVLDISSNNKALSDHALISLGRFSFRTLKRLSCNYLTRITDIGIKALAKCGQLRTLLLYRCERIGDHGLLEVAKHCHELHHLDVSFCAGVTNAVVLAFCRERKRRSQRLETQQRRNQKLKMALRKKMMTGETSKAESIKARSKPKRKERKSPVGRIVIFAGATKIQHNVATSNMVKLNFRDGFSYGMYGILS